MVSEKKIPQPETNEMKKEESVVAPQLKRRRLLKSTVAIPVIMTLSSGAALARTSNLAGDINGTDGAATVPNGLGQDQIVCAIPDPTEDQTGAPPHDLGNAPQVTLGDGSLSLDAQAQACRDGGGILLSATAFTSLQGKGFI